VREEAPLILHRARIGGWRGNIPWHTPAPPALTFNVPTHARWADVVPRGARARPRWPDLPPPSRGDSSAGPRL
jgi:hypothetical protein